MSGLPKAHQRFLESIDEEVDLERDLLGLAAREMAGKLDTIEHLNVTPNLLASVLGEFRRTVPEIVPR